MNPAQGVSTCVANVRLQPHFPALSSLSVRHISVSLLPMQVADGAAASAQRVYHAVVNEQWAAALEAFDAAKCPNKASWVQATKLSAWQDSADEAAVAAIKAVAAAAAAAAFAAVAAAAAAAGGKADGPIPAAAGGAAAGAAAAASLTVAQVQDIPAVQDAVRASSRTAGGPCLPAEGADALQATVSRCSAGMLCQCCQGPTWFHRAPHLLGLAQCLHSSLCACWNRPGQDSRCEAEWWVVRSQEHQVGGV